MPKIQWTGPPPALRDHLFDRLCERKITAEDLYQLRSNGVRPIKIPMSFHDAVALKARLDGNTSAQFHQAAQQHAKATWVYLILAAIVWYFTSWMWALIPIALTAFVAFQSISATLVATRLEKYEKSEKSAH